MEQQNFFSLRNRVAVVTGGGQGIGEGIAARLSAAGAKVAVLDVNEEAAKSVAKSFEGMGVPCDVSSAPSVQSAIASVQEAWGPIDIAVIMRESPGRQHGSGN